MKRWEKLWKLKQYQQQKQLFDEETRRLVNESSLLTSMGFPNILAKLNTDLGLTTEQLLVGSQNRRVKRKENEEIIISSESDKSISDRPQPLMQFISDQLDSSKIPSTHQWKSDVMHTARFFTTFSPSTVKTGSRRRDNIQSPTAVSTALTTIGGSPFSQFPCSHRLNFCKNGLIYLP